MAEQARKEISLMHTQFVTAKCQIGGGAIQWAVDGLSIVVRLEYNTTIIETLFYLW